MRIKSICLRWFRGAADEVCLETKDKSVVIYGPNGAGKSCFADSLEYVTHDGRIGHLSHEYSGKKQEKALSNTSIPVGQKATIRLILSDGSSLELEIDNKGNSTYVGSPTDDPRGWNYRRTILRQDEVSHFISQTKTDKYSALLPLLGLEGMEIAAENLRLLAKKVESESNLKTSKSLVSDIERRRTAAESNASLEDQIDRLYVTYVQPTDATEFSTKAEEISRAIGDKFRQSSAEQRRHVLLQQVAALETTTDAEAIRKINEQLVTSVETHVEQRIGILRDVSAFLSGTTDESVLCPACGQAMPIGGFRSHVENEEMRLRDVSQLLADRRVAIGRLCDTLRTLQANLKSSEISDWRGTVDAEQLTTIEECDVEALRQNWNDESIVTLLVSAQAIIQAAKQAEANAPTDSYQLAADQKTADLAIEVSRLTATKEDAIAVEELLKVINETEQSIRDQIRDRAQSVIGAISTDIQAYWQILHPDVPIEDVCLYIPSADKAIDIHLKFHGKDQDSPRLTLSEGFRNSLGLCIFLAMVKHEGRPDRPLILDDVIVSLDREHRGMVAELLEREFSDYQVIVLTHDREWYSELKYLLNQNKWIRKELRSYSTPREGIRWSASQTTFVAARGHLPHRPDSAANDARKIMDTELAMLAEKLELKLPFLRGDRNDHRMAHEFLVGITNLAKKSLLRKDDAGYVANTEGIEALEKADPYILAWGNRGSHTFSVTEAEAKKVIDICEAAIGVFSCPKCKRDIWYLSNDEMMQCQCGDLKWKF